MKTQVEIKTGFFPLAWFLFFVTPVIEINNVRHTQKWGTSSFDVTPGKHTIHIYFPYLWRSMCGANHVNIEIQEGETKKINYHMPPWMFSKGRITVQ
ncbi:MAG: hypothetical protein ACI837_002856 [Crocinitomicaceae bacterium]|jgi:hypothetical protein